MKSLIVVDCQYDFIDGTLACENAENAVLNIIDYINKNDVDVYYSMDWHTKDNKSFIVNGGIWPVHCLQGERGAMLHEKFGELIDDSSKTPNPENVFYKGLNDEIEEYSAYSAKTESGVVLNEAVEESVVVSGIASEYCVRETALALLEDGFKVQLLYSGLGYVNKSDHLKNLEDLRNRGVNVIGTD
ncbi:isochorismatase family protein [Gudongella sp. DL1XJH-153]|uniref:isochorismatase family protein n=1 Tax=Gudongella sp. DL1XJH-153 TaxID=3409804 RepID=UPI003BB54A43